MNDKKKKRYKSENKQLLLHHFHTLIYIHSNCFTKNSSLSKIDEFISQNYYFSALFVKKSTTFNKIFVFRNFNRLFTKNNENFYNQYIRKYILYFNSYLSLNIITLIE